MKRFVKEFARHIMDTCEYARTKKETAFINAVIQNCEASKITDFEAVSIICDRFNDKDYDIPLF
uniref:Uncharacterized protein n=1 Tax=Siphoviridae sp. ctrvp54 TaxID=2825690 RepID=A0A8S5P9H2_9CAUD|nr:MAG TPA: hypothetical protein [Siphoviridae sp. ctrvp54]